MYPKQRGENSVHSIETFSVTHYNDVYRHTQYRYTSIHVNVLDTCSDFYTYIQKYIYEQIHKNVHRCRETCTLIHTLIYYNNSLKLKKRDMYTYGNLHVQTCTNTHKCDVKNRFSFIILCIHLYSNIRLSIP